MADNSWTYFGPDWIVWAYGSGSESEWKHTRGPEGKPPTRIDLINADYVVFRITQSDGTVVHRTFVGGTDDPVDVIGYLRSIDSL